MNGARIYHILFSDPHTRTIFNGFGYPDWNINPKQFPALFIFNTDYSSGPGEHWCVGYFDSKSICEFFDPYGLSPEIYNLTPIIFNICDTIIYNKKQVQHLDAKTCGHHCLFYSLHRARNISHIDILSKLYTNNTNENDSMVYNFLKKFGNVMSHIQE